MIEAIVTRIGVAIAGDMVAKMYELDPFTNAWTKTHSTGTPPPFVNGFAFASDGTTLFQFGGWNTARSQRLSSFNTATFEWTLLSDGYPGPTPRCDLEMGAMNGDVYLFGGNTECIEFWYVGKCVRGFSGESLLHHTMYLLTPM